MKTIRLDLGHGQFIDSDMPPKSLLRAVRRSTAALDRGGEPRPEDTLAIMRWMDKQSKKHGDIKTNS